MNFVKNPSKSPEGIAWKDYRLGSLLAMAPFSFAATAYLEVVTRFSAPHSRLENFETVPENAILYGFHYDVLANYITMNLISKRTEPVLWIGYHGFLAYSSFFCGVTGNYVNIRYFLNTEEKPLDQLVKLLALYPLRRFGIFTDAGGPYEKVRKSLPDLGIKTNRPLVPLRSIPQKKILIRKHQLPIPGTPVIAKFGKPTYPHESTPALLQSRIEEISRFL